MRPGTHCISGWMGPMAGLDGCGKYCLHRDSIRVPFCPQRVAVPTELSRPVHVRFVLGEVTMKHVCSDDSPSTPVLFHQCFMCIFMLKTNFATRTKVRSLGTFQKATLFRKSGSFGKKITFNFFLLDL